MFVSQMEMLFLAAKARAVHKLDPSCPPFGFLRKMTGLKACSK